jgi:hypothetical protein
MYSSVVAVVLRSSQIMPLLVVVVMILVGCLRDVLWGTLGHRSCETCSVFWWVMARPIHSAVLALGTGFAKLTPISICGCCFRIGLTTLAACL